MKYGQIACKADLERWMICRQIEHLVAVVGSSDDNYLTSRVVLTEGLSNLSQRFSNFGLVCGGTRGGIPEATIEIGGELGIPVLGVLPIQGMKYALCEQLDALIVTTNNDLDKVVWGSETSTMISLIDAAIVVGGSWGTLIEVGMMIKQNGTRNRQHLTPIRILCLSGTGGVADLFENALRSLPTPPEQVSRAETSTELLNWLTTTLTT